MDTRLWLAFILITSFAHFTASNNRIDYTDFPNIRVRLCRFIQVVGTICVFIFPPGGLCERPRTQGTAERQHRRR